MEYLPVKFSCNGVDYTPLSDEARAAQLAVLAKRARDVDDYLKKLDDTDEDQVVDCLARCMTSMHFWFDHFVFTFDPRDLGNEEKRFILFEYQLPVIKEIADCIDTGSDLLIDKSRDMGASWIIIGVFVYKWLFDKSFHAHVGSRKEDLVDDGTVDSLFGKIDYIIDRLPPWMVNGYTKKNRKELQIEHPVSKNLITGESANPHFGRGPRKKVVYFDEYAVTEADRSIWVSMQDTAPCKIVSSTPHGMNNMFADLRFGGSIKVRTLHWTLHPHKDMAWYKREVEKRKAKNNSVAIAQELDIDYQASAGGLVFPMIATLRQHIVIPAVDPQDGSNELWNFYAGFDWGSRNPASFHVYRVRELLPGKHLIQSIWEYYEPTSLHVAGPVILACPYYNLLEKIYADPSMWFLNQQQKDGPTTSLAFLFRDEYKIYFTPGSKGDVYARQKLDVMWSDAGMILFQISEECPNQLREFENLRFETQTAYQDQRKNASERMVDKDNHTWDDFKYFFNSRFKAPTVTREEPPPLTGWAALNKEISELKVQKLEGLTKKRKYRRF